jgi:hypothetical protein
MFCNRFRREVQVTRHARERLAQRSITENELLELLETGEIKEKDVSRLWVARHFEERQDNLVCAAVVLEDKLIVKTVMHYFSWE